MRALAVAVNLAVGGVAAIAIRAMKTPAAVAIAIRTSLRRALGGDGIHALGGRAPDLARFAAISVWRRRAITAVAIASGGAGGVVVLPRYTA